MNQFARLVENHKGAVISFERWGKYRLAYAVNKNDYGLYFLLRFECSQANPLINEIKTLAEVKLHELIMRSIISRLGLNEPLAYQRPQSLEEAPSREVSSFFKEKPKMEDLMNDSDEDDEEESDNE